MSLKDLIIDYYNYRARLQPTLLAILPILIIGCFFLYINIKTMLLLTIFIYCGGVVLFTQIGRERGKRIEPLLYKTWGGKPSVSFLRHRDTRLNVATKARYHTFLSKNVPHFVLFSQKQEDSDPNGADEMYQTATDWLLSQTRDKKKFPLIFEENMNYGFRRNLYALKPFALSIDLVLLILIIVAAFSEIMVFSGGIFQIFMSINAYFYLPFLVVILHAAFITIVVTNKWVRVVADAYACQLLAACDVEYGPHIPTLLKQAESGDLD